MFDYENTKEYKKIVEISDNLLALIPAHMSWEEISDLLSEDEIDMFNITSEHISEVLTYTKPVNVWISMLLNLEGKGIAGYNMPGVYDFTYRGIKDAATQYVSEHPNLIKVSPVAREKWLNGEILDLPYMNREAPGYIDILNQPVKINESVFGAPASSIGLVSEDKINMKYMRRVHMYLFHILCCILHSNKDMQMYLSLYDTLVWKYKRVQ